MKRGKNRKIFYEVEDVVGRRFVNNKVEYKIKWKNYSLRQSTWEPIKNLAKIHHMLEKYDKKANNEKNIVYHKTKKASTDSKITKVIGYQLPQKKIEEEVSPTNNELIFTIPSKLKSIEIRPRIIIQLDGKDHKEKKNKSHNENKDEEHKENKNENHKENKDEDHRKNQEVQPKDLIEQNDSIISRVTNIEINKDGIIAYVEERNENKDKVKNYSIHINELKQQNSNIIIDYLINELIEKENKNEDSSIDIYK